MKRIPEGATNIAVRQHSAEENKEDQNYLGNISFTVQLQTKYIEKLEVLSYQHFYLNIYT